MKCEIAVPANHLVNGWYTICPNQATHIMYKGSDKVAVCKGHKQDLDYAHANLHGGKITPRFTPL